MNELPVYKCNQSDFLNLFSVTHEACQFSDLLSSHDFRKITHNFSQNDHIRNLNYYIKDEFNFKFSSVKIYSELSVSHLNIDSLNSKLRKFYTLTELLAVDFEILTLSETRTYFEFL